MAPTSVQCGCNAASDRAGRQRHGWTRCPGQQAIAVAYGARVARAPELLDGKTSLVRHAGAGVLAGLPQPFTATRHHSLAVVADTVPAELEITA